MKLVSQNDLNLYEADTAHKSSLVPHDCLSFAMLKANNQAITRSSQRLTLTALSECNIGILEVFGISVYIFLCSNILDDLAQKIKAELKLAITLEMAVSLKDKMKNYCYLLSAAGLGIRSTELLLLCFREAALYLAPDNRGEFLKKFFKCFF